jgi:hypothetical protein
VRQHTVQAKYLIYREYQAVKSHPLSGVDPSVFQVVQGVKIRFSLIF